MVRAQLLATLATELSFTPDYECRRALARSSVEMARRQGDPACIAECYTRFYGSAWETIDREQFQQIAIEASAVRDHHTDPAVRALLQVGIDMAWYCVGDSGQATAALEESMSLAEACGPSFPLWSALLAAGALALNQGHLDKAERLAADALEVGLESGQPDATNAWGEQVVTIAMLRGRYDDLIPPLREAVGEPNSTIAAVALAQTLAAKGETDEASRLLSDVVDHDLPPFGMNFSTIATLAQAAEVAAELWDINNAVTLKDRLAPYELVVPTRFDVGWRQLDTNSVDSMP